MTHAEEPSESGGSPFGSPGTVGKVRLVAFTLVVLAFLALNVVLTPTEVLLASFVGWTGDLGVHQVHDMTVAALLWLASLVPMALLLYRPSRRVNAALAPVAFAVSVAVMAFLADSFLFAGFAVSSALALGALLLHPAGRSLVRFDRAETVDRRLVGLFVIGALPLLAFAGRELAKQLGPADEHVVFVHYGAMAIAAFFVVLMGALALVRRRDWRFAARSAGLMAAFVGLASVAYPTSESSLGTVAGGLLALWAVVFAAGVEYSRQRSVAGETETPADTATGTDRPGGWSG